MCARVSTKTDDQGEAGTMRFEKKTTTATTTTAQPEPRTIRKRIDGCVAYLEQEIVSVVRSRR